MLSHDGDGGYEDGHGRHSDRNSQEDGGHKVAQEIEAQKKGHTKQRQLTLLKRCQLSRWVVEFTKYNEVLHQSKHHVGDAVHTGKSTWTVES